MPPKKSAAAAKPAASKAKAPAKAATKAAPKKASPAVAKGQVPEAKPVAGTKRKSSDDDETEVEAPKAKRNKVVAEKLEPEKELVPAKTTKVASKVVAKKPAAFVKAIVPPKKATTNGITKTTAPKKAASTTKATAKVNGTKRASTEVESEEDEDSEMSEAPKTKKGRNSTEEPQVEPKVTKKAAAKPAVKQPAAKAVANKPVAKKVTSEEKAAAKEAEEEAKAAEKKEADEAKAIAKKEAAEKRAIAHKAAEEKRAADRITAAENKVSRMAIINDAPTAKLDIYVFGENSAGELGLGSGKDPNGKSVMDVKRPRINHLLLADKVGVTQIAVGGMHCVALTHDDKIYTWGVNDQGALGRVTDSGPMRDMDAEDDEDSEDAADALNASEATPAEIDYSSIPRNTKFAGVFAGDSVSFALTTTGLVYGWGTFRGNDGILGFGVGNSQANAPKLIDGLKKIVDIACGTNHVLALDNKGKVFTWGAGEQNQLARRVLARHLQNGLVPREFGMGKKKIVKIGAGDYHSFLVDDQGVKYAWGLNSFGQTGIEKEDDEDDVVMHPTEIPALKDYDIKQIVGGSHHSMACTTDGKVLVWGRCDNHESGMELDDLPKDKTYFDAKTGKPRYLSKPLELEIKGVSVATAGDTCMAIDGEGKAWTWGFSDNYQTGQGVDEDVCEATEIDNSAVRGKKIVFGGVGGQFGVLGGLAA